jgi:Domain of unknown function (DUF3291)
MTFHFAEFNIARLKHPLNAEENAEFASVLDPVTAIAEVTPGFVWRLKDDQGRTSSHIEAYTDPNVIVNLTVWETPEALRQYTYRSGHGAYFRRRSEWFEPNTEVNMVCWWIPEGTVPSVKDAMARLDHLRAYGPSENGFLFTEILDRPID